MIRCRRSASISSTRLCFSRIPTLLTRPVSVPSSVSTVRNSRFVSSGLAMSAWTAIASPPLATTSATTARADSASAR
jgi:hypothetical protein